MSFNLKLSDKAKAVIRTVAPGLAAALGGPLAGAAAGALVGALGGDEKGAEDALLAQKPETLLALRKAEQDFALQMEQLGVDREKIAASDRASARDMAKVDMRPQMVLSGVFLGGYFLLLLALITGSVVIDGVAAQQFPTLMGVLTTGVPIILAFWFGSSSGSQAKSVMLANSKPADSP
jgi:hypothetical protein